jgi:antigen flippase
VARYLGPTVRGQYAAVTAWFGAALVLGELGQCAAICYYVARDPRRAKHYVATARNIMLCTGGLVAIVGVLVAPALAHGNVGVCFGYRLLFAACPLSFVGASYLFALQGRSIGRWLVGRATQPIVYLLLVGALKLGSALTLRHVLEALVFSFLSQTLIARELCSSVGLTGGRGRRSLGLRLTRYGTTQILATTPTAVNTQFDQLLLSQTVAAAALGRYAIAVSLTSLAFPLVAPIGYVLFPRLAAERNTSESGRNLQKRAMFASFTISIVLMAGVTLTAHWVIPLIFGPGYRSAGGLVLILAPGGVFCACSQVAGDLLRGRHQQGRVAWAQGVGAIVTVTLLFALVPALGVTGAAIASSCSYAVTFIIISVALLSRPSLPQ